MPCSFIKTAAHLLMFDENSDYKPTFYRLKEPEDEFKLKELLAHNESIRVFDHIFGQVQELVKIRNPSISLSNSEKEIRANEILGSKSEAYGVWVYYPWSGHLIHILDEDEFIELRTSRNKYKITAEEQEILRRKKVGIIGLSVGQSIAITMTIERLFGEVRLADFDDLELSNLNRLRAGLHQLGNSKVLIAAREIAEIDPFITVIPYFEGITEGNIDSFLTYDAKLDILIEECDSMDIKILSRLKAKNFQIPVIMDTNDRGMLDIERFDLEPARPIFHGRIDHLPALDTERIKTLNPQERLAYMSEMVGIKTISSRMKESLPEIGKSITTWPQLASSVMLGGAMVADTCRRIFLDQLTSSGRYYVDFDQIIS